MNKRLSLDKYQQLAQRTSPDDGHDKIDNGILGLIGETGELVDEYKKWQYQSEMATPLPAERFAEELGDVLWYLAELASGMGRNLSSISNLEFSELTRKAAKRSADRTMRALVVGLSARSISLARAIQLNDAKRAAAQLRMMLVGSGRLAFAIGYDLEMIAQMNIRKLQKRYPNGFDAEISMRRYAK